MHDRSSIQGPSPSFVVGDACAERANGTIVVTERVYGPGILTDEHAHEYACLDVVLEGAVHDTCLGTPRDAAPGGVLWYAPDAAHVWASGARGARLLHTIIPRGWLGERTPADHSLVTAPGVAHAMRVAIRTGDSRLEIESLAFDLLERVRPDRAARLPDEGWIARVVELLRQPGAERLSLEALADAAGLSAGHMARAFRATLGCSPGEFSRRLRVHRAAIRLARSGESITTIAHDLGFADHPHLSRVFRREVGCTPSRYRASFREG